MKLTYLGTAAAEGFPALFCHCEYCNEAKKLGGKNVRTRSQALINKDLLIDFPADTYAHFLNNGIDGDEIEYLIVTHAHMDHFYLNDLFMRSGAFAHNMRAPTLNIFCPKTVFEQFTTIPQGTAVTVLEPYRTYEIGAYHVTPLPARHMFGSEAFIYLIQGDKTLLYAHDTGYFYEEVFDYIEKSQIVLDMISLDCTNVDIPIPDEGSHMGFQNIERLLSRLSAMGAVTDSTIKYVNHFSHNGNPLHHVLEKRAKEYDCHVSYDGCSVVI